MNKEILTAKKALLEGKVVCFPTETVMGLGVIYSSKKAYELLNVIKRRPEDKPYTLMLGNKEDINKYAFIDEKIKRVIDTFLPGSLTLLLKSRNNLPSWVTHNQGVVGIRIPSNIEALSLLKEVEIPLLVPSANRSGEKPALSELEAKNIFGDEVSAYISGKAISTLPSTIIDFSKDKPILIRQGEIAFEKVLEVYHG